MVFSFYLYAVRGIDIFLIPAMFSSLLLISLFDSYECVMMGFDYLFSRNLLSKIF